MNREPSKKIIFCTPQADSSTEKLLGILYSAVPHAPLEIYCRTRLLKKRLLGPKADISSAVLMVTSTREMEAIMPLQPLLEGVPVLLVLPDNDRDTIAMGHRFSPRLLTYRDGDLSDVAQVATMILKKDGVTEDVG